MSRIFISYRRVDSIHVTGRIYDRLVTTFGGENIFRDIDSIGFGTDFRHAISTAISESDAILIIIGDKWLTLSDENGNRRLDNLDDLVRIEVETSLKYQHTKLVIPVLVNDAKMPNRTELPESLRPLTNLNAAIVRSDPDFHRDMDRIIAQLPENDSIHYYGEVIGEVETNWTATFFPTNDLTGTGVPISGIKKLYFNWGTGIPVIHGTAVPGIGVDNFSVRFHSVIAVPKGKYKFTISNDNQIRVYVDGALILEKWIGRPLTTEEVFIGLAEGQHNITVEYAHLLDQSIIKLVIERTKSK